MKDGTVRTIRGPSSYGARTFNEKANVPLDLQLHQISVRHMLYVTTRFVQALRKHHPSVWPSHARQCGIQWVELYREGILKDVFASYEEYVQWEEERAR